MPGFGIAVSWMVISPIGFLTAVIGVIAIIHYKPLYHSCDVALISLLITMATNAWLLLPIPAVMELGDFYWTESLCTFYVWLSITLRCSHLLVLLALNIYWMASLRMSGRSHMFSSSKCMKVCVIALWFISIIVGFIPVTGGPQFFTYYKDNTCMFLPTNISIEFGVMFIIVPLISALMGFISTLDTFLIFLRMRDVALTKYNAGRFHMPTISGAGQNSAQIHAKYNELNVSIELCRFVLIYSILSAVINALPLMVSQFVQLTQYHSREAMETTLLWLLLMETLTLPHSLWLLSKRYRHAIVYTWKVFVLRDANAKEDDAAACSLQAYRLRAKEQTTRPYRNGVVSRQVNGTSHDLNMEDLSFNLSSEGATPSSGSQIQGYSAADKNTRGRGARIMTTDLDDGMTVVTTLTSSNIATVHEAPPPQNNATSRIHNNGGINKGRATPVKAPRTFITDIRADKRSPSPTPSLEDTPTHVKRSSSSRQVWKDRMRKQHLPSMFVNESFEDDKGNRSMNGGISSKERENQNEYMAANSVAKTRNVKTTPKSATSASDYHHDTLSDSLPSSLKKQYTMESEGVSGMYDADDIDTVLNDSVNNTPINNRTTTNVERMYKTYEDLSQISLYSSSSPAHSSASTQTSTTKSHISHNNNDDDDEVDQIARGSQMKSAASPYPSANILGVFYGDSPIDLQSEDLTPDDIQKHEQDTEALSGLHANNHTASLARFYIRPSNYRKFLPYTNLVISNVDDVEDVGEDTNENKSDSTILNFVEGQTTPLNESENLENSLEIKRNITKRANPKPNSQGQLPESIAKPKAKDRPDFSEMALQDYGQLQTVSGVEMLQLKMRSVRTAAAVEFSDDTASEEGGLDNIGFDDIITSDHGDSSVREIESSLSFNSKKDNSGSSQPNMNSAETSIVRVDSGLASNTVNALEREEKENVDTFDEESLVISSAESPGLPTNPTSQDKIAISPNPSKSSPKPSSKAPVLVLKPRYRREAQDNTAAAAKYTLSEKEPDFNFVNKNSTGGDSVSNAESRTDTVVTPTSVQIDMSETESNESEHSVIIEPYGQRTPAWMNDNSLSSTRSSVPQYEFDDSSESDAFGSAVASTDFRSAATTGGPRDTIGVFVNSVPSTDSGAAATKNCDLSTIEEYDFDSVTIGDVSAVSNRSTSNRQPLEQFHFDHAIESGFKDALAIDYMVYSNVYNRMGLCFESIKEEPEDSLSESASTFSLNETNSSNTFKTQAVVSRPSSRASITDPSTLEVTPSAVEKHLPVNFKNGVYFNPEDIPHPRNKQQDRFPILERTSADGSEEIVLNHKGNSVGSPRKAGGIDPWSMGDKAALPGSTSLLSQSQSKLPDDFETADDLQTNLATGFGEKEDEVYDSPWLDLEDSVPRIDHAMSFDSNLSPHSEGRISQSDCIELKVNKVTKNQRSEEEDELFHGADSNTSQQKTATTSTPSAYF